MHLWCIIRLLLEKVKIMAAGTRIDLDKGELGVLAEGPKIYKVFLILLSNFTKNL
jgi:hypothetical protein